MRKYSILIEFSMTKERNKGSEIRHGDSDEKMKLQKSARTVST